MSNQAPDNQNVQQSQQQQNNTQSHSGRKPDEIAYSVQPSQDGKGHWNRIGAAWYHKDGRGSDVILNSTPVNGRITLREQRDQRMQDYQEQRHNQAPVNNTPEQSYEPQR